MPPAEKTTEPTYAAQTKLAVVNFRESVPFGGELTSAAVPIRRGDQVQRGSNSVDEIRPAWLLGDGSIATIGELKDTSWPADGVVLRSKVHDQHSGKRIVRQVFVPWSNVKSIGYAE